jgi:hypothetical protein
MKLIACPPDKMQLLQQMPGVFHRRDPRRPDDEGWFIPRSLWEMGRRPAGLLDYPEEEVKRCPKSGLYLKSHQLRAVSFLRAVTREREGAVLAADAGTGKTAAALHALYLDGYLETAGLICAPLTARLVWCGERSDPFVHYGLDVFQLEGVKNLDPQVLQKHKWFFIHYDVIHAWQPWLFAVLKPRAVIFDESHYLMNRKARRGKAARAVSFCNTIDRRYCLTGTPIPNARLELWQQLSVAQPRQWGLTSAHDFGVRYCLSSGTLITLGSFEELPIEQLRVGDVVLGYRKRKAPGSWWEICRTRVLAIHHREVPIWKLELEDGTRIYSSVDHQWLDGNGRLYAPISTRPNLRRGLHRWQRCGSTPSQTPRYIDGWLRGVLDGDGCARQTGVSRFIAARWDGTACFSVTLVQATPKNEVVLRRLAEFAEKKGWKARIRPRTPGSHDEKIASLVKSYGRGSGRKGATAKPCYAFATEPWPCLDDFEYWRGWLAGMYDAEGAGSHISQDEQANPEKFRQIGHVLNKLGLTASPLRDKRRGYLTGWRIGDGVSGMLRFRAICDPCHLAKLDSAILVGMECGKVGATKFTNTGLLGRVFNITTETGNYFADGFASKNCQGQRKESMGIESGGFWEYKGESNSLELRARLAGTLLRYTREEIADELPKTQRHVIPVEDADPAVLEEYSLAQRDVKGYLKSKKVVSAEVQASMDALKDDAELASELATGKKGEPLQLLMIGALIGLLSKAKRDAALKLAVEILRDHDHVVIFSWRVETCEWLYKKLAGMAKTAAIARKQVQVFGPAHYHMPIEKRIEIAVEFAKAPAGIYVATRGAVGIAINELNCADAGILVDLGWNPAQLVQTEARIVREGNPHPMIDMYFLVMRGTIDDHIISLLESKAQQAVSVADTDGIGLALARDLAPSSAVWGGRSSLDALCARLMDD